MFMYLHTKFHVYSIILTSFKRGGVILLPTPKRIPKKPSLNRVKVKSILLIEKKNDSGDDNLIISYSRIDLKNNESIFSVQFQKVISEKCDLRHETRNPPHRWDLEAKTWGPKVGTRDPYYT